MVSSGPGGDRGLQIDDLALFGARRPEPHLSELSTPLPRPTAGPADGLTSSQRVMALRYAALARDIRAGGRRVPDFADGLRLHRLLDAVRLSAGEGRRLDRLTG